MGLILRLMIIMLFAFSSNFAQIESNQIFEYKISLKMNKLYAYDRFTTTKQDNISSGNHSFINLSGQALVGSTLAFGFSILPFSAGFVDALSGKSTNASQTALGILAISSYLFGAAVGVHWIASYENPNLSFWGTVGYSVIGGSVGIVLVSILASYYTTIPTVGVIIVALTPITGSMTYASFISEWSEENQEISLNKINLSHKDLIEQSKIINVELLRIKL